MTAVVVVNPTKVTDDERAQLLRALRREGVAEVSFVETTAEDPGVGQSREAVEAGADVVIAWGGDGTVMACVTGVAGTDTPLAIMAGGTGNLLARNLDIPLDLAEGAGVAAHGARRRIDVGALGERRFAVMAGIGFDAAMLQDASEKSKARIGPVAYVASGLRQLSTRRFDVTVTVDDQPPMHRRARTVLVGNVGKLQGGLPVLPDAVPDDGVLDVVVISPRTRLEWVQVAWRVVIRRPHPDHMDTLRGRRILIETATPQPHELDGEVLGDTTSMCCEVQPGALLLCVPSVDQPRPS